MKRNNLIQGVNPGGPFSNSGLVNTCTWVTVCFPALSPFSLSALYGGIGAGEAREWVSPGPRVE